MKLGGVTIDHRLAACYVSPLDRKWRPSQREDVLLKIYPSDCELDLQSSRGFDSRGFHGGHVDAFALAVRSRP